MASIINSMISGAKNATLNAKVDTTGLPGYTPDPANWYKAQPYGFMFYNRLSDGKTSQTTVYLPISPSNLNITTHYATNIVTTLYGVVEEHSEIRYYDITISGTTGYAPQYVSYVNSAPEDEPGFDPKKWNAGGRSNFEADISINFGGFFPELQNKITGLVDAANNISETLKGDVPNPSGVKSLMTGYMAFHRLYKMFLKYKEDTVGLGATGQDKRKVHPLWFVNYKDNNKYCCIPVNFTMTRSAESPMLYFYNIKLRAFNLQDVNAKVDGNTDLTMAQFGLGGINQNSLFGQMTSIIGSATTVVSTLGSLF